MHEVTSVSIKKWLKLSFRVKIVVIRSVTQKNVPSAVVYYYYAWYVFLRDRRYYISVAQLVAIFIFFSA